MLRTALILLVWLLTLLVPPRRTFGTTRAYYLPAHYYSAFLPLPTPYYCLYRRFLPAAAFAVHIPVPPTWTLFSRFLHSYVLTDGTAAAIFCLIFFCLVQFVCTAYTWRANFLTQCVTIPTGQHAFLPEHRCHHTCLRLGPFLFAFLLEPFACAAKT